MILFTDGQSTASNVLFPAFLPGANEQLLGYEFSRYWKHVPVYVLMNSAVVLALSLSLQNLVSRSSIVYFCVGVAIHCVVIALKLYRRKGTRLTFRVSTSNFQSKPAPALVWLENFGTAANFVLIGRIGYSLASEQSIKFLAFCLILFYLPLSLMPFINLFYWKKNLQ